MKNVALEGMMTLPDSFEVALRSVVAMASEATA